MNKLDTREHPIDRAEQAIAAGKGLSHADAVDLLAEVARFRELAAQSRHRTIMAEVKAEMDGDMPVFRMTIVASIEADERAVLRVIRRHLSRVMRPMLETETADAAT